MVGNSCKEPKTECRLIHDQDQEHELIAQVKAGSQRALRQLIKQNRKRIMAAVRRYSPEVDRGSLVCAGESAVDKAAQGFDMSKGRCFLSYFTPILKTEVQIRFCDESGISREKLRHLNQISEVSAFLRQELFREPSIEEISFFLPVIPYLQLGALYMLKTTLSTLSLVVLTALPVLANSASNAS